MTDQSMRGFLDAMAQRGRLLRVVETVDARFELGAWLAERDGEGPMLFEAVAGHDMRVAGNLLDSLESIAEGLGTSVAGLQDHLVTAIGAPLAPRALGDAPCQEVEARDPDLAALPIPQFFEHETGPYISAGAIVARDTLTGRGNLSIARLKPLGGNRAFIGIAPNHHLAVLARAAKARGERLEIAVTVGNHPVVMLAACLYLGLGDDELHVAGALLGEAIETVACRTVDLAVPACCELVLEGALDPDETVEEGPVSEFHGMYERYGPGYVVTFSCLTRRKDAIWQAILPGYAREHVLIGAVAIAAGLQRSLKGRIPSLRAVAVTAGGAGRLHAVLVLENPRPGEAKKAIFAVWGAVNLIKQVTVVDGPIDPWDARQVEWAVATRMRPERDLIVVPGVQADRSEPLEQGGTVGKLGIDATTHAGDRADWTPAQAPDAVVAAVRAKLSR